MTRLSEQRDVQNNLIHHLMGSGWTYLPPADVAQRRGGDESEPFLPGVLRAQLPALNPGLVTESNLDAVIRRLRLLPATLEGNERFVQALRGHWTVYDSAQKRERNLTLLNYDNLDANRFHFTQELTFVDRDRRRMDMVLWANGLPLVVIENKAVHLEDPGAAAFEQVQHTYSQRIAEFIKYPPLMVAAGRGLEYAPTWNPDIKAMNTWKVEGRTYGLEQASKTLLARRQVLDMVRDYLIFYRADDQTSKFVCRPHQVRAVNKIVHRVLRGEHKTGLHWHTQGSGKTLTMIVAAHVLRREMANPTLLIVVDRLNLESQMVQNLEAFGFPAVERAASRQHLRRLLSNDHRGLIVTLIHKFDRIPENLIRRDSVVVLIDEAHRSQEGDLGTYMRAALPNAFYFGFTGTPIDRGRIGQGTYYLFGRADAPHGYQDKYGMDESIADGATVRLWYTLAPTELRVDRDALEEEFYRVIEREGAASIEAVNNILRKADKLKAVMHAPHRVAAIAQHVAAHFQNNVAPRGFKAFLVAIDRRGCALYKEALDAILPAEMSRVVYTAGHKDDPLLRRYHLKDDEEKRLRKAFRNPDEPPQILIVTEKLLTGYDAPVLACMYLDKPLKDHTLLQAIARVNRPYPNKESGLIVDYVGVFENLQRALSADEENPVPQGLADLARMQERFAELHAAILTTFAGIDITTEQNRSDRILDYFDHQERRQAFFQQYKELQAAYEILSPDPFLRPYLDDYALITQIYRSVYSQFSLHAQKRRLEYQILQKTEHLIRENVMVAGYITELPLYPISRDIANIIAADNVSDRVKVSNLYRSIMVHIEENEETAPYLLSIGDQVERVIQALRDRQISAEDALRQMEQHTQEIVTAAEERQRHAGLDNRAFTLLLALKGLGVSAPQETAVAVSELLAAHPGWLYSQHQGRLVRRELVKILRPVLADGSAKAVATAVDDLLRVGRTLSP